MQVTARNIPKSDQPNIRIMKTHMISSALLAGAALTLGAVLAISTASAGPGPDYWRNLGKKDMSAPALAAPAAHAVRACTDARLVSITETKSILPNGRGPVQTVEVGRKLVCTSCDIPMIAMKPSLPNGRGPMVPVAIRGTHDCTNGCAAIESAP